MREVLYGPKLGDDVLNTPILNGPTPNGSFGPSLGGGAGGEGSEGVPGKRGQRLLLSGLQRKPCQASREGEGFQVFKAKGTRKGGRKSIITPKQRNKKTCTTTGSGARGA